MSQVCLRLLQHVLWGLFLASGCILLNICFSQANTQSASFKYKVFYHWFLWPAWLSSSMFCKMLQCSLTWVYHAWCPAGCQFLLAQSVALDIVIVDGWVAVMSLEENISLRIVSELTTHLALGNAILLAKSGHQTPSRQQQPWTTLLNISVPVYVGQAYTPWLICYSPHYTPSNRAVQRQNKLILLTWKIISVWLRKDMGMWAQSAYIFLYFAC